MNNINRKKTSDRYSEAIVQPLFAGFSILVIFLAFGVIFFINPVYEVKKVAYACGEPTETPTPMPTPTPTPTDRYTHGVHIPDDMRLFLTPVIPNVPWYDCRCTGEENPYYNCHGFSFYPNNPIYLGPQMDYDNNGKNDPYELYYYATQHGYGWCTYNDPDRVISYYTIPDPDCPYGERVTHTERRYSNELSESKLGVGIRMTHPPGTLNGPVYGTLNTSGGYHQ